MKGKRRIYVAVLLALAYGCKESSNSNNNNNNNQCVIGCISNTDCVEGYACINNKCIKQYAQPVANAGGDVNAYVGDVVFLNGCESEGEGRLSYSWAQTQGTDINLNDYNKCLSYFLAQQEGTLEFKLRVCDEQNQCSEDKAKVTITKETQQLNNRPVVEIPISKIPEGFDEECYNDPYSQSKTLWYEKVDYSAEKEHLGDQTECISSKYILNKNIKPQDGSVTILLIAKAYDSDGDQLTYEWEQISGPNSTVIYYPNEISTQVIFPNPVSGNYVFKFTASDGKDYSEDFATVYVRNNIPPIQYNSFYGNIMKSCDAGYPCPLPPGFEYVHDPDGKGGIKGGIVRCEFNFGDGSPTYVEDINSAPDGKFSCTTRHTYSSPGEYTLTLTITDNNGSTDVATYQVWIDP